MTPHKPRVIRPRTFLVALMCAAVVAGLGIAAWFAVGEFTGSTESQHALDALHAEFKAGLPERRQRAPSVVTIIEPSEAGEGGLILPVAWQVDPVCKLPVQVDVLATSGETVATASLSKDGVVIPRLEEATYFLQHPAGLVVFGYHRISVTAGGHTRIAVPAAAGQAIPVVDTVAINMLCRIEGSAAADHSSEVVVRMEPMGESPHYIFWPIVSTTCTLGKPAPIRAPRLQLMGTVAGTHFRLRDEVELRGAELREGSTVTVWLHSMGTLNIKIVESAPGDFVQEVKRQDVRTRDTGLTTINAEVVQEFGAETEGAPARYHRTITCDAARLERIGSGTETIQAYYRYSEAETRLTVTITHMTPVAAGDCTIAAGATSADAVAHALSRTWTVELVLRDQQGNPVVGEPVGLNLGIWVNRALRGGRSWEAARIATAGPDGRAVFERLPTLKNGYAQLVSRSGRPYDNLPQIVDCPEGEQFTTRHATLLNAGMPRFAIKVDAEDLRATVPDWQKHSPRFALYSLDRQPVHATDDTLVLDGSGNIHIPPLAPGRYGLIVSMQSVIATATFAVGPGAEAPTIKLGTPRVARVRFTRDSRPVPNLLVIPAMLPDSLAWFAGKAGSMSLLSLGQAVTDEQGLAQLRLLEPARPENWTTFHDGTGVHRVVSSRQTGPDEWLAELDRPVPGGSLSVSVLADYPDANKVKVATVSLTPVFHDTAEALNLDMSWGVTAVPKDGMLKLENIPEGQYLLFTTLLSNDDKARLATAKPWMHIVRITPGGETVVSLPSD